MSGMGSRRAVVGAIVALAGGCDFIFRVDRLPDVHDDAQNADAAHDGAVVDMKGTDGPPVAFCGLPTLDTMFTGGSGPCSPWGSLYASNMAMAGASTGGLTVTPVNQLDSVGGCYSQNGKFPLGMGGIYALVTDALHGTADNSTYTVLQVHNVEYQIKVGGTGNVAFQTSGSQNVGVSATFMPPMWFRIQPVGNSLTGAISRDGADWTDLGATAPLNLPTLVDVEVSAGVNSNYLGGTGTFRRLVICP